MQTQQQSKQQQQQQQQQQLHHQIQLHTSILFLIQNSNQVREQMR